MLALVIDTSTERGVVALVEGSTVYAERYLVGNTQSKFLMKELAELFKVADLSFDQLTCIGIGVGPGSYTGIRVGASAAKALAYAWKLPLIGISSLKLFIPTQPSHHFAALIDARMGGVYFITGFSQEKRVSYLSFPQVSPLGELHSYLKEVDLFVTPSLFPLESKLSSFFPKVKWEEVSPSVTQFGYLVKQRWEQQEWELEGRLELSYLRKSDTEFKKTSV